MSDELLEALLDDDVEDLYENAPCGFLSMRPDGTVVKVNETFVRMSGRSREELLESRFQHLLTPGGQIYYETHIDPMLRMQDNVREIAVDLTVGDGGRLPVLVNAVRKGDAVRAVVFDATERRAYELELLVARDAARAAESRAKELAATLQASLIPPDPPHIAGLDVATAYRPAGDGDEVGGDFYDVFENGRRDWGIVLGDVCGKGAAAATVTALARYTVRAAAARTRKPRSILGLLNDALIRQGSERFCTAVYMRVRLAPKRVQVTVCSGGHWLPLRLRAGGEVTEIGRAGTLLGILDDAHLSDVNATLDPGDAVVLFTDGVVEARRGDEMFGHERLAEVLRECHGATAQEITACVMDAALGFQEGLPRDDIAVVVLRVPDAEE
jgi:sigma-B regulation protein RsbU (phosphoserine phosphatase)